MSYTETLADGTVFGNVPGIQPGTFFRSRRELHDKKLHKGLMNGIATRGSSIVLSGGYVDDEDLGNVIIYTGEGGRDQRTGRQIADQQLTAGNLALAENQFARHSDSRASWQTSRYRSARGISIPLRRTVSRRWILAGNWTRRVQDLAVSRGASAAF